MINLSVLHNQLGGIIENKLSGKKVPNAVLFYEAGTYPPMGISDHIVKELEEVNIIRNGTSMFLVASNAARSALVAWNFSACHNVYVLRWSYLAERGAHVFTGVRKRTFISCSEDINFIVNSVEEILKGNKYEHNWNAS